MATVQPVEQLPSSADESPNIASDPRTSEQRGTAAKAGDLTRAEVLALMSEFPGRPNPGTYIRRIRSKYQLVTRPGL